MLSTNHILLMLTSEAIVEYFLRDFQSLFVRNHCIHVAQILKYRNVQVLGKYFKKLIGS